MVVEGLTDGRTMETPTGCSAPSNPTLMLPEGGPDNGNETVEFSGNQRFVSAMEQIKQQIARENINFVRFEATDLHGVSSRIRVPMPRSYLELTLSPKSNEVDHANTANFSSDVLLIPDLSTFRVLPWAEQTARVICDPCTVTGSPLRTSPRLIAKQLLGQLQSLGFSLHSSFTYECCVLGAPDRIGPKTLLFPATTLLSNHDLPFFQQLVDSMYCMGADIDSIASASGPGQMEINLRPEFGIAAADSAFTFRTGIKKWLANTAILPASSPTTASTMLGCSLTACGCKWPT
ncbi:hypothetical protein INR49_001848 [Caranx melampygus]|nr:hypothetical protein INR49_001848 [Caranx melampygus]